MYVVIIGSLQYNYGMIWNLICFTLGLSVVRCMFQYPKTSDLISSLQSLKIWSLLAMNQEQKDIASGLELEEWLLFSQLLHLMSLISQIVLERNSLTNHLPKINLQKLTIKRIQIKEEMVVYNLLITINLIIHDLKDLTQVYWDQIPKIVMMIFMVHQDHPNKQIANQ